MSSSTTDSRRPSRTMWRDARPVSRRLEELVRRPERSAGPALFVAGPGRDGLRGRLPAIHQGPRPTSRDAAPRPEHHSPRTDRLRAATSRRVRSRSGRTAAVADDRGLPDHSRDRPRGHGGRLRGDRAGPGPPRGAEGPAGARVPDDVDRAVPPRGARRGQAASHQHRARLRRGRGRGPALLRHAVHREREPRPDL